MGLLSNRVDRSSLKPGDHIYSWRTAYVYAHHGIYVGEDKVIHFTRRGQEVGTGTMLDVLLVSSAPAKTHLPCPTCAPLEESHGVVSSCLDCFLAGGNLYRFEYAVSPARFIMKGRGGTCSLAVSDADADVIHRATYLLDNGFGFYNAFNNNCEDFAIYCKTGVLVLDQSTMGQSGQAVSIIGWSLSAVMSTTLRLVTANVYGMAAISIGVYCASRYAADIGMRRDVAKIPVEDLTTRLAIGMLQVLEPPGVPDLMCQADYDSRVTEATASSQDQSQIDLDDIFLSVAETKKGAFGTGAYGKTVSSSRRSCASTASSVPQPDPRVEELQTEVTQLRDQMHEVTDLREQLRESDERTRRLEMLHTLLTQGQLAPPSGPQPPQPPPTS